MNATKLLLLVATAFILSGTVQSQTFKQVGNELVQVDKRTTKKQPIKTEYTVTIKSVVYPVYKGSRGGLFINRISKKTGKKYKQYIKLEK